MIKVTNENLDAYKATPQLALQKSDLLLLWGWGHSAPLTANLPPFFHSNLYNRRYIHNTETQ